MKRHNLKPSPSKRRPFNYTLASVCGDPKDIVGPLLTVSDKINEFVKPDTEIVGDTPIEAMWAEINRKYTEIDTPPEGALSKQGYAEKFSTKEHPISTDNAGALLDRLTKNGELESGMFSSIMPNGKRRTVRFYWPKKA